jgi:hypothetical protein
VSIDPNGRRTASAREAHTDPMIPRITDDMLPPLERSRVPALDDDSVAEMIAELDDVGVDQPSSPGAAPSVSGDVPPAAKPEPARRVPSPRDKPSGSRDAGSAGSRDAGSAGSRDAGEAGSRDAAEGRGGGRSEMPKLKAPRPRSRLPRPLPEDEPDAGPRTYGPADDPSVLRESADGPVLRSRYGDFRPPVPVGRRSRGADDWYLPDAPSLTGLSLTRRSWSRRGSRLFAWTFVAIFTLILVQLVVGLYSAAA